MKFIKMGTLVSLLFLSHLLWAQTSPIPMLQGTADNILAVLDVNQKALKENKGIIYQAVKKYLLPNVDTVGMSRSVLGRNAWLRASKTQRKAFVQQFTQLVVRTYASPLAEYKKETVRFLPVRGGYNKRFVTVNSVIIRESGAKIPLSYSLVDKKGRWKIYDINVEGVSLLQSYRTQFSEQLQRVSMDKLIQQMKAHNAKNAG